MYYFRNQTKDSPMVILDSITQTGLIKGSATSDDWAFYQDFKKTMKEYCQKHSIQSFSIKLEHFNLKMAKSLLELLKDLKTEMQRDASIHWMYEKEDTEMKQMGQYYSSLLGIDFNFIEN